MLKNWKSIPAPMYGVGVGILIFLLWAALWCITRVAYRVERDHGISAHGQFGDAFGSLNALFTGWALAGLVYTAILQQHQLNEQRKEIAAHETSAEENRLALFRQRREQSLTARLNATVALSQAHGVFADQSSGRVSTYVQAALRAEARKLRQRVAILLCEANLGFDGKESSLTIQRQAIREYLVRLFRDFANEYPNTSPSMPDLLDEHVVGLKLELENLSNDCKEPHPVTSQMVDSLRGTLLHFATRSPRPGNRSVEDWDQLQKDIVGWIGSLPYSDFGPTDPAWRELPNDK